MNLIPVVTRWRLPIFIATAIIAISAMTGPLILGSAASVPSFNHVFVVIMENHSYGQIIGSSSAPYINGLAKSYGLATNYHAVSHPSLPNYLALTGGSTFGITTDCAPSSCPVNAVNLADRIEGAGRTWRAYMESMPSACDVSTSGTYAVKHNPFVYFNDIRTNAARCAADDVQYTQLSTDLASASTTPNFVWITPNLCNDMHDCSITTGDNWLKANLPTIFNSAAWTGGNSVLFLTWDEDSGTSGNQVATLVISPAVPTGFRSSSAYTHYSLLRTIETAWGLASLTGNDSNASPMADFFGAPTATPTPTPTATATPTPTPTATATPLPTPTPTGMTPIRATFYYPWYPEHWSQGGITPATQYHPWLGYYDDSQLSVERSDIAMMQYAQIQAGIASWWGQGTKTDSRIPLLLQAAHGTGFEWTLYYEKEGSGDPSASTIAGDLAYINAHYAGDSAFLHVNGRPVLFIYDGDTGSCSAPARWLQAQQLAGTNFYLDEQVFAGYRTCASQPDSWHQYSPALREDHQAGYSFTISPGFWKYNESTPRLSRDVTAWATAVRDMVASKEQWQLITTFNEWNEGTSVESAMEWTSSTGQGPYLDKLHSNGQ